MDRENTNVFDRLTDARAYTGSARFKFCEDSLERGSRDWERVSDLSEITRPGLRGAACGGRTSLGVGVQGLDKWDDRAFHDYSVYEVSVDSDLAPENSPAVFSRLTDPARFSGTRRVAHGGKPIINRYPAPPLHESQPTVATRHYWSENLRSTGKYKELEDGWR
eukprot:TRINITY_DN21669_c1_g1_i1.p1 TRINITY_DN21669_c1_g1~~TRINITY_DN21669_c1_g1_i1.p1  ORF type:complete len:164 (+),score=3.06 TRINITY_DN21669_c1_g1_i1:28-519(+)